MVPQKTKTQIKAYKSFDYACRQASKCRHERFTINCSNCPDYSTCDIQARIKKARKIVF